MRPQRLTLPAALAASVLALTGCGLLGNTSTESQPEAENTSTAGAETTRVLGVLDADTVKIDRDGTTIYVDLLGLATPQAKHDNEDMHCLAPEAAEYLGRMLPIGTPVTLTYDPALGKGPTPDGATPATTYAGITLPDGRLVNAEMARAGYGTADSSRSGLLAEEVTAAQAEADQNQNGLYSRNAPCTLPARLTTTLTSINEAQGLDLKDPLEAADALSTALARYENNPEFPLLASISGTHSVTVLADALTRAADSKRVAYSVAEEAERERAQHEEDSQDASPERHPPPTSVPADRDETSDSPSGDESASG